MKLLDFWKKMCWPKNGHFRAKKGQNEVLGHFLGQYALVFGDFAYDARYLWYLIDNCAQGVEKKFAGPKMSPLGPKRGQNEVLGHFHVQNALVSCQLCILWLKSYNI